ncbi:hypothetical protein [Candidatus Phytoplasma pruni]|uniref:Uncharacterized protein n=1 Tax=Candidatus Phytoplasma pruni TaxID=479893 RepID=A0A851HIZ1_9MOLU|nr:hypothetical protein [Candidatus Phytoplasma pruni]NWN45516.1 hypothetical protein [Candidatus Phytoplasma pruni]
MSRLKQYLKTHPKKLTFFIILSLALLSAIIITATYNLIPYFRTAKTETFPIPVQAPQHELTYNGTTIINLTQQQAFDTAIADALSNTHPTQ